MGGPGPETREILLSIPEEEWRRHYRELVIYAHARCRRWLWRTGGKENLPEGYSPDTIAQEAIARLYDGTRVWNHEQYPGNDPVPFLKSVADSLIWALLSGVEHKRTVSLEQGRANGDGGRDQNIHDIESGSGLHSPSPLTPDDKIYLEDVERRIRAAIADRQDLVDLFEYLLEGMKPKEIAARMGADVKQVYARRKTFDRRTAEIQRELFGTGQKGQRRGADPRHI